MKKSEWLNGESRYTNPPHVHSPVLELTELHRGRTAPKAHIVCKDCGEPCAIDTGPPSVVQ